MSSVTPPDRSSPATPEVPSITPAVRRRLQQCYDHAKKLMTQPKYDFDYANASLTECITSDPGNLVYLEAFFENLAKKYDNNKRGAKLQLFLNRGPFKKALASKQWLEVLKTGPEILKVNPWDIATLRGMAEACEQLQLSEVELRYLKNALDGHPKDADVNRHCARSLARMGQYDQAIACWARVSEIKRNDPEAQKMIGDLQIEKTKWKFGMVSPDDRNKRATAGQGSGRAIEPAFEVEPLAPSNESPKKRDVQLTPWQRLEQAIQNDPTIIENYLELATVYADEGRLADAEKTLQKGLAASGNDLRVRERLEEAHVLRLKQQLAIAEQRAQVEATESAQELVKQLRDNLNRVELELFGQRAQRYPAEAHWKLELGIRLKRAGNFSEAIKRLGEIGQESDLAPAAALEIGESLQHLRQFPRALQAYRQAVMLAEARENADQLKLSLYRGGVLGAAMGDPFGAEMLRRLVALDADYRDGKERLARTTAAKP